MFVIETYIRRNSNNLCIQIGLFELWCKNTANDIYFIWCILGYIIRHFLKKFIERFMTVLVSLSLSLSLYIYIYIYWFLWNHAHFAVFSGLSLITIMYAQCEIMFLWQFGKPNYCVYIVCIPLTYSKTFTKITYCWKRMLAFSILNDSILIIKCDSEIYKLWVNHVLCTRYHPKCHKLRICHQYYSMEF